MKNISVLFLVFLMFSCSDDHMSEKKEYMSEEKEVQLSPNLGYKDCETNGGLAGDEGLKTWCWTGDLANEINNTTGTQDPFSSLQLAKSANYHGGSIFAQGGRLHFSVNPTSPPPPSNPNNYNYNYRAEICDTPSNVDHEVGTEQWWGFDYRFGDDYRVDELPWILWQTHGSFKNPSNPMTSLQISEADYWDSGSSQGELVVANSALSNGITKVTPTGIIPVAGQTLNIVIHLVWGDNNEGLYRVWVDDVLVYSQQERTVYAEQEMGGYWKIGIYKWLWQKEPNVNSSALLGINQLNTSIGNLRVIKNSSGQCIPNAYDMAKPTIVSDDTCPDDLSNANSSIAIASQEPGSWDGCKLIAGVLDDTNGCVLKLQKNEIGDQYAGYRMIIDLEDQANNISDGDKIAISLDGNGVDGNAKFKVFADNNDQSLISHEYGKGQGWSTYTQEVTVPNGATELFLWLYPNMGSTDPGHSLFGNLSVQEVD